MAPLRQGHLKSQRLPASPDEPVSKGNSITDYENFNHRSADHCSKTELLASAAIMFDTFDSCRSEAIVITPNTPDRDAMPLVASIKPNTERTYEFKPMNFRALLRILRERGFRVLLGTRREGGEGPSQTKKKRRSRKSKQQLQLLQGVAGIPSNQIICRSAVIDRVEGVQAGG